MDKLSITFLFLLLLLLQLVSPCTSSSSLGPDPCDTTSSCGEIRDISYPFRLTTDPINCGDNQFEITCDNNVPMFIYNKSERYYVRSIDYNNFTIRLSDALLVPVLNNNTFLCNHSHDVGLYTVGNPNYILSDYSNVDLYYGALHGANMPEYNIVIMSCAIPLGIDKELYKWEALSAVDGPICSGSMEQARGSTTSFYWYAGTAAYSVNPRMLQDSCRVELMLQTSKPLDTRNGEVTFHDVLESWSYGFEVSWLVWLCSPPRAIPCTYPTKIGYFLSSIDFVYKEIAIMLKDTK